MVYRTVLWYWRGRNFKRAVKTPIAIATSAVSRTIQLASDMDGVFTTSGAASTAPAR